jgi:hypothetical protein
MSRALFAIFFCAFFLIISSVMAQEDGIHFPVFSIRANPFSFVESDAGIQVGMGYRWKKRWGVTLDPTYIFYTPVRNFNTNERDQRRGLKIRSDIRYYFNDFYFGRGFRLLSPFLGPELHYKYVSSKKLTDFGINCVGQQCDYYMTTNYREIKNEMGVALKTGFNRHLSTRLDLEVYGGIGVRVIHVYELDIPLGGSFIVLPVHDEMFGTQDGTATIYAPIGFKLVYSFYR